MTTSIKHGLHSLGQTITQVAAASVTKFYPHFAADIQSSQTWDSPEQEVLADGCSLIAGAIIHRVHLYTHFVGKDTSSKNGSGKLCCSEHQKNPGVIIPGRFSFGISCALYCTEGTRKRFFFHIHNLAFRAKSIFAASTTHFCVGDIFIFG